ncbi:hypothetical protein QR685DRAFT_430800, partial [Neurospora intermedia]
KGAVFSIIINYLISKATKNIFRFIYKFNRSTPRLSIVIQLLNYSKESYLNYHSEEKINIKFKRFVIRNSNQF